MPSSISPVNIDKKPPSPSMEEMNKAGNLSTFPVFKKSEYTGKNKIKLPVNKNIPRKEKTLSGE